ncbi:MAG: tRNA lysidine(34) synthetase TilS [Terriglobales bacterium]
MSRASKKLTLEDKVLAYIHQHELLCAGDRVGVAVSGGADSVALLRLLLKLRDELGLVLSLVHFNHRIRGAEADADEHFVAALADRYQLFLHRGSGDAPAYAKSRNLSLETAARELRYAYFSQVLGSGAASKIATGHTLDDQAETVLLRLIRGAGTRGLAGIYPKLTAASHKAAIVRPLLAICRSELEQYLRSLGQDWREDASNRDLRHARNRVRHRLLPLLETEFNPAIRQVLGDLAEIARGEEGYWQEHLRSAPDLGPALKLFPHVPLALQRRLVRAAAEREGLRLRFEQIEAVRALVEAGRNGRIELPQNTVAELVNGNLAFRAVVAGVPGNYDYALPVPGEVYVPEAGRRLRASLIPLRGAVVPAVPAPKGRGYNRDQLLDPVSLGSELRVRNWRPGDRYWPAHTKSPKKVKELLQGRHISGRERALWPVLASGDQLVWMRGFPVPAQFAVKAGATQAVQIDETKIDKEGTTTS